MIQLSQIMEGRTYPESGKVLYEMISPMIAQGQKVEIDANGVVSLPSMFLNVSIGKVVKEYGADALKQNVSFRHITKTQAERLKAYLERM